MGRIISKVRQARLDYQQRIGRDVSIQEVATAIGISRAALSNIERGRNHPSNRVLAALCQFYNVLVGDLLEYVEEQFSLRLAVQWTDSRAVGSVHPLASLPLTCGRQCDYSMVTSA